MSTDGSTSPIPAQPSAATGDQVVPAQVPPATGSNLRLRYSARSDVGLVRQGNEDSGYAGGHMLVVADGMGGHAAGELASSTAIATFAELDMTPPGDQVLSALADAVENAHEELARIIAESPDFAGMGTTVTAMSWEGDRVAIAHVGDSRAYLLRDGKLQQLTKDHTFVQTLVDSGRITPEEAAVHDKRNLLTKALDGMNNVEPDLSMREVRSGDRFLLCSDGLSGVLRDTEIKQLLSHADPTGAVTALVERALEAGAPDNVTCVVADLVADETAVSSMTSTPVVVGAAAEPRNRDRLPGIEFPEDSQPDPDRSEPPAPVAEAPVVPAKTRHLSPGPRILLTALSVLAVLLIGVTGFWWWTHNQYYVGNVDGKIGIYQGINDGPGEHGFSKAIQTSQTPVSQLPIYSQDQVNNTIPASNLDAARNILATLEAQAAQCQTKPATPGCPSSPDTTDSQ